jgi:metacaspase-1
MNLLKFILKLLGLYKESTTTSTTTIMNTTDTTTTQSGTKRVRIALCVGLNIYPNPANDLAGCVNDANDMSNLLKNVYGFDEVNILLDSNATYANVTGAISDALAKKPDVFVYTNSSHGTRIPDTTGTEEDGYCEAICLYDKFLVDHDFHNILTKADPKTHVIVFSDSCHSAGVTREFLMAMNDSSYISKPKYLPHPDNMQALKAAMAPTTKAIFEPNEVMNEVLLAGCKSDQYSYDASFDNKPNGAFTYYAVKILSQNPSVTYEDFVSAVNQYLPSDQYPQCPVCETNSNMKKVIIFS